LSTDTRNRKRKGLENQLQPAQRTQRKKDDVLIDELAEITVQSQVLDMLRNGRSIMSIGQRLSISPTEVRKAISSALAAHQESVSEHAEYVYNVNYLRLEGLFSQAMEAAFGFPTYADKGDKDVAIPPSDRERQWSQFALNVLKEQNKMAETQLKYLSPVGKHKDKGRGAKTEIYAPTIIAGDSLFQTAQSNLSDSFMDAHGHRLGPQDDGDLNVEEVLLMELHPPDHISPSTSPVESQVVPSVEAVLSDNVRGIEENLGRLQEHITETINDDRS